jgi:hypothetical protein
MISDLPGKAYPDIRATDPYNYPVEFSGLQMLLIKSAAKVYKNRLFGVQLNNQMFLYR